MQRKQNTVLIKRCIDVCMTILLLCLMAYQVTGEQAHEWIGVAMTLLVIIHQVLNRKWYAAIFTPKLLCRSMQRKDEKKKNSLVPVILMMAAVILGLILNMAFSGNREQGFENLMRTKLNSDREKSTID